MDKCSPLPRTLPPCFLTCLIYLGPSDWGKMKSWSSYNLHFLMAKDVEHFSEFLNHFLLFFRKEFSDQSTKQKYISWIQNEFLLFHQPKSKSHILITEWFFSGWFQGPLGTFFKDSLIHSGVLLWWLLLLLLFEFSGLSEPTEKFQRPISVLLNG